MTEPYKPRLPSRLVTVTAYGPAAPSARVRVFDWVDYLGLDAAMHTYAGLPDARPSTVLRHPLAVARAEAQLRRLPRAVSGPLLLSREASPLSRGGLERRLMRQASHTAYDFDDALFEDVHGWRRALGKRERCKAGVSAADVVIAGNQYLADWASNHAADVRVIPSCVDPHDYQPKSDWRLDDTPRLVWLGSKSTERYLDGVAESLSNIHRATGARLLIIGGRREREHPQLQDFVERVVWHPSTFARTLSRADIALAPLDDTPSARGKCAYKLLQYAATGLPMVGSPVGANTQALERFLGLPASSTHEWDGQLTSLLEASPSERERRGRAAMMAVRNHYSFEAWASHWCAATGIESPA